MTAFKTTLAAALLAAAGLGGLAVVSAPTPATAQSSDSKAVVDAAKADGVIGESVAGYLAVVSGRSPTSAQRAAMDDINIKRKSVYTRRAAAENASPAQVARVTGEQLVAKAPPGQMVLLEDGRWSPGR